MNKDFRSLPIVIHTKYTKLKPTDGTIRTMLEKVSEGEIEINDCHFEDCCLDDNNNLHLYFSKNEIIKE